MARFPNAALDPKLDGLATDFVPDNKNRGVETVIVTLSQIETTKSEQITKLSSYLLNIFT